jgi:hypothetical protein
MLCSSITFAVTWTVLHFAAMFACDVSSVETFVKYLIVSFVITNVVLTTVSSREYFVNKLRYTLYACSVLVPVVYWILFSAIRCFQVYSDPYGQFSEVFIGKLLADGRNDTTRARRYVCA